MPSTKDTSLGPVRAARTAAGRFQAVATGRAPLGRADAIRRVRAAQRTLQPRESRFAHLKHPHD